MVNKKTGILELIIALIIVVAIAGSFLGIPGDVINQIIEWLVSIFVGVLLSLVAGSLVEAFTGDTFKTISLNIPIIGDFSISISAFVIATIIVKILLFGF